MVARLAASALAHLHGDGCGRGDTDRWASQSAALPAGCARPSGGCGGTPLLQGRHRHEREGFCMALPACSAPAWQRTAYSVGQVSAAVTADAVTAASGSDPVATRQGHVMGLWLCGIQWQPGNWQHRPCLTLCWSACRRRDSGLQHRQDVSRDPSARRLLRDMRSKHCTARSLKLQHSEARRQTLVRTADQIDTGPWSSLSAYVANVISLRPIAPATLAPPYRPRLLPPPYRRRPQPHPVARALTLPPKPGRLRRMKRGFRSRAGFCGPPTRL